MLNKTTSFLKQKLLKYLNDLVYSYLRSELKKFDLYVTSSMFSDVRMEGDVLVAEDICFEGSISANSIQVEGSVMGDLISKKLISISDTASVKGNIVAHHIVISEGAEIFGSVKLVDNTV